MIDFRVVKVNIPQKKLRYLYHNNRLLTKSEYMKIGRKMKEIEAAIQKLQHVASIVERIKLRYFTPGRNT